MAGASPESFVPPGQFSLRPIRTRLSGWIGDCSSTKGERHARAAACSVCGVGDPGRGVRRRLSAGSDLESDGDGIVSSRLEPYADDRLGAVVVLVVEVPVLRFLAGLLQVRVLPAHRERLLLDRLEPPGRVGFRPARRRAGCRLAGLERVQRRLRQFRRRGVRFEYRVPRRPPEYAPLPVPDAVRAAGRNSRYVRPVGLGPGFAHPFQRALPGELRGQRTDQRPERSAGGHLRTVRVEHGIVLPLGAGVSEPVSLTGEG